MMKAKYTCASVRQCMFLEAAFRRLKKHTLHDTEVINCRVRMSDYKEYKGCVRVAYASTKPPVFTKPDAITNDCGAMVLQLGQYRYIVEAS